MLHLLPPSLTFFCPNKWLLHNSIPKIDELYLILFFIFPTSDPASSPVDSTSKTYPESTRSSSASASPSRCKPPPLTRFLKLQPSHFHPCPSTLPFPYSIQSSFQKHELHHETPLFQWLPSGFHCTEKASIFVPLFLNSVSLFP